MDNQDYLAHRKQRSPEEYETLARELRESPESWGDGRFEAGVMILDAADAIVALQTRVAELESVLAKQILSEMKTLERAHDAEADLAAARALLPTLRQAIDNYDSLMSGYHYRNGLPIERPNWGELIAAIDALAAAPGSKA